MTAGPLIDMLMLDIAGGRARGRLSQPPARSSLLFKSPETALSGERTATVREIAEFISSIVSM